MMNHIDVSSVLRQTVACDLYSNLVTRSTGAAVRGQIERLLGDFGDAGGRALTVIDFSHVSMIDFSCADEVVAKLLMRYTDDEAPGDAYFLFRGVNDDHWDAISAVLDRHGLALALEADDGVRVVGVLSDDERRVWRAAYELGRVGAADVASELGADPADAERTLDCLCRRRLVMRVDGDYVAVGGGFIGRQ
jgi:hypothetical protein